MVIILKKQTEESELNRLRTWLERQNVTISVIAGEQHTLWGVVGDTSRIDTDMVESFEAVEGIRRISEPYKLASRSSRPGDTVIDIGNGVKIGGGNFTYFAGPCTIESEFQIISVAKSVKAAGAHVLRGGAFKPRTSPYTFQGMRDAGLRMLLEAKKETGLPVVTEIMDVSQIELFEDVDIIQVGARNMQNYELLKELGKISKPVFLKRGQSATYQDLLMSAEYIMAEGNPDVILCERGIRTFEPATRNTLDLASVPYLKGKTHLPVIVDPSHASGMSELVKPLAFAAAACGADGLMIEVHNNPSTALCDGPQAVLPDEFSEIVAGVEKIRNAIR